MKLEVCQRCFHTTPFRDERCKESVCPLLKESEQSSLPSAWPGLMETAGRSKEKNGEGLTPRTDACQGSDGTISECDELAELARQLERELAEREEQVAHWMKEAAFARSALESSSAGKESK